MKFCTDKFIKYDWSGKGQRTESSDVYRLTYGQAHHRPLSFREECLRVARLLAKEADQTIYVALSGGIDSEVVCRAFLEAEIPFEAVTFRYNKFLWNEMNCATQFCERYGIKHHIIAFNEEEFLRKDIYEYAEEYRLQDPFAAFDIRRMELIDGFLVFGTGDILLELNESDSSIFSREAEALNVPRLFQGKTGKKGCYQFFQYTPEIMLSFLYHPFTQLWIELAPKLRFENIRYWKRYLYKQYWPDMAVRDKFYGYEKFAELYLKTKKTLEDRYLNTNDQLCIPVGELIDQLDPTGKYRLENKDFYHDRLRNTILQ